MPIYTVTPTGSPSIIYGPSEDANIAPSLESCVFNGNLRDYTITKDDGGFRLWNTTPTGSGLPFHTRVNGTNQVDHENETAAKDWLFDFDTSGPPPPGP